MTACFTTRGSRIERHGRLSASRIVARGNPVPPSVRHGVRWRALPVEGSRAFRDSRRPILRRLLGF